MEHLGIPNEGFDADFRLKLEYNGKAQIGKISFSGSCHRRIPMTKTIEAMFDGIVFRPIEPIALEANTNVRLTVETLPSNAATGATFLQAASEMNLEGPPDWATNLNKYLYDEGSSGER
jgi:hypothetical protein